MRRYSDMHQQYPTREFYFVHTGREELDIRVRKWLESALGMQLLLKDNLPFTTVTLVYQGTRLDVQHVLVDTGSASTIFAADVVAAIGIVPQLTDTLQTIQGVGGIEVVFTRRIDALYVEEHGLSAFEVEVGGMDYGFEIDRYFRHGFSYSKRCCH